MIVVTIEGASVLWQQILKIVDIGYPFVHLIGAAHTPQHSDTEGTFHGVEVPLGNGYAPIQLTQPGANWSFTSVLSGVQAQYLTLTWGFTAAVTIFGYWLSDGTQTYSLWGEAFAGQFTYGPGGGQFNLTMQPWLASWPDVNNIPCSAP